MIIITRNYHIQKPFSQSAYLATLTINANIGTLVTRLHGARNEDTRHMFYITHNEPKPECSAVEFAADDLRVCNILLHGAQHLAASADELCRIARERGAALTAYRRALRDNPSPRHHNLRSIPRRAA